MGVVRFETEFVSNGVPPSNFFKALFFNFNELLIKAMPQVIKSVEILEGDGGVGTLRQINFHEGFKFKYAKEKIEAIDEEKLSLRYTVPEGDLLEGTFEKIENELKFEASPDGVGTILKKQSHYYIVAGHQINEEEFKNEKQQSDEGFFKAIEAYLLANPNYASIN